MACPRIRVTEEAGGKREIKTYASRLLPCFSKQDLGTRVAIISTAWKLTKITEPHAAPQTY